MITDTATTTTTAPTPAKKAPKPRTLERAIDGDRTIILEAHKRTEYDRGYWLVKVRAPRMGSTDYRTDTWGALETEWHGCHGTTYHLSDNHGRLHRLGDPQQFGRNKGVAREIEVQARCPDKRDWVRGNCGKPQAEWGPEPKASDVMLELVAGAIADGTLRAPAIRRTEIAEANARSRQRTQAAEESAEQDLRAKAREVLQNLQAYSIPGKLADDIDVDVIVGAMKWAQSK